MVGATTLLSGDLNILKHEPHLEYERIYSFIMSNMDETQVKIYTEKYKDYTFDRPHTTYNVYGTLQEMREKHALHELPIKADHLIYYFNIYEKSDKFCAIYLD